MSTYYNAIKPRITFDELKSSINKKEIEGIRVGEDFFSDPHFIIEDTNSNGLHCYQEDNGISFIAFNSNDPDLILQKLSSFLDCEILDEMELGYYTIFPNNKIDGTKYETLIISGSGDVIGISSIAPVRVQMLSNGRQ